MLWIFFEFKRRSANIATSFLYIYEDTDRARYKPGAQAEFFLGGLTLWLCIIYV
jgi:hypothetical protein